MAELSDVDALKAQVTQLAELVKKQAEEKDAVETVIERAATEGMRKSDFEAEPGPEMEAHIALGRDGWVVNLVGEWTQNHINQVRMAMRRQMLTNISRAMKDARHRKLAHRKSGKYYGDIVAE